MALRPTDDELASGVSVAVGAHHVIVVPSPVVRARVVGMLFETDKTFLLPTAMPGIRRLRDLYDRNAGAQVLVSGHADRAGSSDHNLTLSVERAESIAAFLQDEADDWLSRYDDGAHKSAVWGAREDQYMLSAVNGPGAPYFSGTVTGRNDAATRAAVKKFQTDKSIAPGAMNADTRRALVQAYMALDGTTLPAGTTIATHGCGESHPSVATADSVALAENRRVEVFFFRGPPDPAPADPCPAGGCAQYPQWVDKSTATFDVNADAEVGLLIVDELGLPLANAKVRIVLADGTTENAVTAADGTVRPRVGEGDTFDVLIPDAHEGGVGDALETPSGKHFTTGGDGP